MAQQNNYPFKTPKERARTLGSAVVGLTALGFGLSAIFNPVALGVAGAYAAYKVGSSMLLPLPSFRNRAFGKMVKKGHAELLPEDADICRLTKEISDDLGRPAAPKIYTVDALTVGQSAFPLGLKWMAKLAPIQKFLSEQAMPKFFGAVPGANTILTTKEALTARPDATQMRFVAAHEMSHLKTDHLNPALYARVIVKKVTEPLMLAVGIGLALSVFGVALPVSALGLGAFGLLKAGAALVALKYASNAAINFGLQALEKRADRNALYVTRDLKGAEDTMGWLHEPKDRKPVSLWKESKLDHPSYCRRVQALKDSFNMVSKYPPLQPTNDNAQAAPVAAARSATGPS